MLLLGSWSTGISERSADERDGCSSVGRVEEVDVAELAVGAEAVVRRVQMTGAAISVTVDGEPSGVGVVLLRQQSVVAPESPHGLAVGEQVLEAVDGLRQLISAFDDVGPQGSAAWIGDT